MTLVTALVALIAAVIGGLLAPYITQSRDRLAARAAVYDALAQGRHAWFPTDVEGWSLGIPNWAAESFIREFESVAMMARVPRRLTGYYVHAVRTVQANPGRETGFGGWAPAAADAALLDKATRRLVFWSWHPMLALITMHVMVRPRYARLVRFYDWTDEDWGEGVYRRPAPDPAQPDGSGSDPT